MTKLSDTPLGKALVPVLTSQRLDNVLPKHLTPERAKRLITTTLHNNPKLMQCIPDTVIGCCIQASSLGLELNSGNGDAWMLPFKGKDGQMTATLVIGYKGHARLAYNSGQIKSIITGCVVKGDTLHYATTDEGVKFNHVRGPDHTLTNPKNITHAYCLVYTVQGGFIPAVLTRADVEYYRNFSKAPNSPAWKSHWPAMAMKTAALRALNLAPKSSEMSIAMATDEQAHLGEQDLSHLAEDAIDVDFDLVLDDETPPPPAQKTTSSRVGDKLRDKARPAKSQDPDTPPPQESNDDRYNEHETKVVQALVLCKSAEDCTALNAQITGFDLSDEDKASLYLLVSDRAASFN